MKSDWLLDASNPQSTLSGNATGFRPTVVVWPKTLQRDSPRDPTIPPSRNGEGGVPPPPQYAPMPACFKPSTMTVLVRPVHARGEGAYLCSPLRGVRNYPRFPITPGLTERDVEEALRVQRRRHVRRPALVDEGEGARCPHGLEVRERRQAVLRAGREAGSVGRDGVAGGGQRGQAGTGDQILHHTRRTGM